MIKAACHCGAVRFEIAEAPVWVLDCNCSICRRHGALWSYYQGERQALLLAQPDPAATAIYLWNDRAIELHHCRVCGCVTHIRGVAPPALTFGVNARLMVGLDPAKVAVRQIDNGHTGFFWTKSDEPPIPGRHPPMPPPGPDDWR
jgi:hypothetical protein